MAKKNEKYVEDYIVPLNINHLQGRMLYMPAPKHKTKDILFVYGHHSSLERWWGVVQDLNRYGAVTVPDLPGFGGMDSFYRIGEKANIDNLADYLATFIKLRFKRKRITIAGLSFGFVIVTRMLQNYPDLAKKVDLLVSVVGFAHKDDFTFSKPRYLFYRWGASLFSHRLPAIFFKNVCLLPAVLRVAYAKTHNAKNKFDNVSEAEIKRIMDFEIHLWRCNDVQTYMATTVQFLTLDNCKKQVDLPLWHISVKADRYFDNRLVEQHMKIIYNNYHEEQAKMDNHAPSIIADKKSASKMFPPKLRRLLNKKT